jgi:dynein assembly factor 1
LYGILQAPSVTVLDLQDNKVDDISKNQCSLLDILEEIFEKLPNLAVLYFQNNPAVKNIKNYRKTYIHKIANLKYLDDKPVFPEERS